METAQEITKITTPAGHNIVITNGNAEIDLGGVCLPIDYYSNLLYEKPWMTPFPTAKPELLRPHKPILGEGPAAFVGENFSVLPIRPAFHIILRYVIDDFPAQDVCFPSYKVLKRCAKELGYSRLTGPNNILKYILWDRNESESRLLLYGGYYYFLHRKSGKKSGWGRNRTVFMLNRISKERNKQNKELYF